MRNPIRCLGCGRWFVDSTELSEHWCGAEHIDKGEFFA